MHPEFILPADQKQAWLQPEDRGDRRPKDGGPLSIGRSATRCRSGPRSGPGRTRTGSGPSTSWESTTGATRTRTPPRSSSATTISTRRGSARRDGWDGTRFASPTRRGRRRWRSRSTPNSRTRRRRRRPSRKGAFVQAWAGQVGDIALITASILGAVFFTILLVTGNTMSQSVRERTGEWGVLKALGFTSGQVLGFVLTESFLLVDNRRGGRASAGADPHLGRRSDGRDASQLLFPDGRHGRGSRRSASLLGFATGVFPAVQAMRLRVADALRRM